MSTEEIELTEIENYATQIVIDYAEGGVEDDVDEDGVFEHAETHEEACDLALLIIRGMKAHPEKLLEFVELAKLAEAGDEGPEGGI